MMEDDLGHKEEKSDSNCHTGNDVSEEQQSAVTSVVTEQPSKQCSLYDSEQRHRQELERLGLREK